MWYIAPISKNQHYSDIHEKSMSNRYGQYRIRDRNGVVPMLGNTQCTNVRKTFSIRYDDYYYFYKSG